MLKVHVKYFGWRREPDPRDESSLSIQRILLTIKLRVNCLLTLLSHTRTANCPSHVLYDAYELVRATVIV